MNHQPGTIILVRGLPGSGKSYLAARLRTALGDNAVMLDPDATDYESEAYAEHVKTATADGVDAVLHPYRFLRGQAYKAIEDGTIAIWNQPFTNLEIFNKMVAGMRAHAAEHNTDFKLLVVEVEIDPELAKVRVTKRKQAGGHGPDDATFARFVTDYKTFAPEGYQTVTIDGTANADDSLALVINALQKL